jgi:hypothetical protein
VLPTRWVIAGLFCLTIASLTALVLVATVKKAEALSTVALALAVLAFVAELLLALSQTASANQQFAQTSRINAQTQEALAEIRFATGETLARRDRQFDRLLESVVPAALAQSLADQPELSSSIDVDALSGRLAETVVAQLDHASMGGAPDGTRLPMRSRLDTFVTERPGVAEFLRALPTSGQLRMWRYIAAHIDRLAECSDNDLLEDLRRYERSESDGEARTDTS